eukprot:s619_g24.t1
MANDAPCMEQFVTLWRLKFAEPFGVEGFKRHDVHVASILAKAAGYADFGYSARLLPQCHRKEKGSVHVLGLKYFAELADRWPVGIPTAQGNAKPLAWVADLMGMSTSALIVMVVARDIGSVVPDFLYADTAVHLGPNAKRGLQAVLPVPPAVARRMKDLMFVCFAARAQWALPDFSRDCHSF